MDARTFKTLELDALIELLARHIQTPLGRTRVSAVRPSIDAQWLARELDRTSEGVALLASGERLVLSEIEDPESSLQQLKVAGTILEPNQILMLEKLSGLGMSLREQFDESKTERRYKELSAITGIIPDLRKMLASIRGKILPNGEIDDNASPDLRRIRRTINENRTRIYRNLETLMRDRGAAAVQDEIVTIRNGRFVIPLRTDSRTQIPGVIHGLSSSGLTTYVEPLAIINQNNELASLREQEQIEIARILSSLTEVLRANAEGIEAIAEVVSELDFINAKARLSQEFRCVRPEITQHSLLRLSEARHPLLEQNLKDSGGSVVPISLELNDETSTMVISGPNAGGKTVVLKTVGLISLMAQMGLHVPAREAAMPVFEQVLADIGDQQSIAANLSTFTAHIRNIAEMASQLKNPALILIDEVGTGTDPDEGAVLGVAIVDYFRARGGITICTTHYNYLKVWASRTEGVINASVEFDEESMKPTYHLIVGIAGASSGIEIARRMNLPDQILTRARTLLDPTQRDASDYLKQLKRLVDEQGALTTALEEERDATAQKYAVLDLEFAKREARRRAEFEDELARVIREFATEGERLIGSVKDRVSAMRLKKELEARTAELRKSAAVRLRKQAAASPTVGTSQVSSVSFPEAPDAASSPDQAEIAERDLVRIKSLDKEGTVEIINDGTYTVIIGSLRFRARRDELELLKAAAPQKSAVVQRSGVSAGLRTEHDFNSELNIIGIGADEASDRVDKFLDDAYLAGVEFVRIVHGHGKGVLRRTVADMLTNHPHVQSFRIAPQNEGGSGATIAELRK
jgi:DNA mismatch repair protein MutS2